MYTYVWKYKCSEYVETRGQPQEFRSPSAGAGHLFISWEGLSLAWSSLTRRGWPTSCLYLLSVRITGTCYHAWYFMWIVGVELWSLSKLLTELPFSSQVFASPFAKDESLTPAHCGAQKLLWISACSMWSLNATAFITTNSNYQKGRRKWVCKSPNRQKGEYDPL